MHQVSIFLVVNVISTSDFNQSTEVQFQLLIWIRVDVFP